MINWVERPVAAAAVALALLVVFAGAAWALNYDGEEFCQEHPAWPGGTYLGHMHPFHVEFYKRHAQSLGIDPCPTWAADQRNSAIKGLRELGYTVSPPGAQPVATTQTAPATPTQTTTPTATPAPTSTNDLWRGLVIAPENRCTSYDSGDYSYPQSVEPQIAGQLGGNYGPYTGTWFSSLGKTDIEHIIARSEAHDSGLCAADAQTRTAFARDLLNLTLASPSVNRRQKAAKDVAEWLPDLNACWYVDRTLQVRRKYELTIDQAEADAADKVLAGCTSTALIVRPRGATQTPTPTPTPAPSNVDALAMWDDNGNGRITCAEARAHGIAPVRRGHPAYPYMTDRDGDGVVCE